MSKSIPYLLSTDCQKIWWEPSERENPLVQAMASRADWNMGNSLESTTIGSTWCNTPRKHLYKKDTRVLGPVDGTCVTR